MIAPQQNGRTKKHCSCCSKTKPTSEFYVKAGNKDCYSGICRTCSLARDKEFYNSHIDECRTKARNYYRTHKKARLQYARDHYAKKNNTRVRQRKLTKQQIISQKRQQALSKQKRRENGKTKAYSKSRAKLERESFHDNYIKTQCVAKTILFMSDIPLELIELKREHVKLSRILRRQK